MRRRLLALVAILGTALVPATGTAARELTFEQRVEIETSIQRAYHAHQIGASRPFETAHPRESLEPRVRRYLKLSVALENYWNTPVTGEMLRREAQRIGRDTCMPDRLHEIYAAVGYDAFLFEECVARQTLVVRLTRSFFSDDPRIHAAARTEAEQIRDRLLLGELDPTREAPHRTVTELVRADPIPQGPTPPVEPDPEATEGIRSLKLSAEAFDRRHQRLLGATRKVVEEDTRFVVREVLSEEPGRVHVATYSVLKVSWDEWWSNVEHDLDAYAARPVASDSPVSLGPLASSNLLPSSMVDGSTPPQCLDGWSHGSLGAPTGRRNATAV